MKGGTKEKSVKEVEHITRNANTSHMGKNKASRNSKHPYHIKEIHVRTHPPSLPNLLLPLPFPHLPRPDFLALTIKCSLEREQLLGGGELRAFKEPAIVRDALGVD